MSPSEWDICWSDYSEDIISLSVLLPNGLFLNIDVSKDATLLEIKAEVWESAQHIPLFGLLQEMERYVWVCINGTSGEREEQVDETRMLREVRPFQAVLRLIERKSDKAEQELDAKIKFLVGKGLQKFESQMNVEVSAFRRQMRYFCENVIQSDKRQVNISWREKLLQKYPVIVDSRCSEIPAYLVTKIPNNKLMLTVRMEHATSESTCKFSISTSMSSSQLLSTVLEKKMHSAGLTTTNPDEYILKVCGLQEYIAGSYLLSQYTYIRNCISCGKVPELLLVASNTIRDIENDDDDDDEDDEANMMAKSRCVSEASTLPRKSKKPVEISSWTIQEPFTIRIENIHRLNCENKTKTAVKLGLFQGDELLCKTVLSKEATVNDGDCVFEEDVVFEDLSCSNIPRVAKLCICVYEISKTPQGSRNRKIADGQETYAVPVAWVNTTVFDFKGILKNNLPISLYMWPYDDNDGDCEWMLKPLGTVVSNPQQDQTPVLVLSFSKYNSSSPIAFPPLYQVLNYASTLQNGTNSLTNTPRASKSHLDQLRQICERDALYELHEQEKELLWFLREDCCAQLPNSLPKLLTSLKWNDRNEVAQMTLLLQKWPRIDPVKALELLDYAYADREVRNFAVLCVRSMTDEELSLYSLQLVRALKHEAYLHCHLVELLLERALTNAHFGHKLFWLLRSEMKFLDVSIRFGLILEAFCRASSAHVIRALSKQIEALHKLKVVNELVRNDACQKKENKDKLKMVIQKVLSQKYYQNTFRGMRNPLDPRYIFRKLKVEKCKFLDSKMKPLWLTFENSDSYGKDIFLLFKNGDDLRQDMLTLQMILIMDRMWKDEGLDLRMIPYQCLATDHKVGLIEIVPNADTIANIQKERGFSATSAFKKGSLLAWLKEHNQDDQSLSQAVEEFTLSCAGYCVATYVLGVADRHSDNIMVKTNGQLFHIDFGHILGKFKEKFGIKRERVPFVLTHDFVYIITKGNTQKSQEFNRFQQCCEQAFLTLRRKGPIVISLFAMMLSTGIPELSCERDLDYLRETLVLDVSETEALRHFRAKFDDALRNSWKTSVNWLAHNLAKDNKMAE